MNHSFKGWDNLIPTLSPDQLSLTLKKISNKHINRIKEKTIMRSYVKNSISDEFRHNHVLETYAEESDYDTLYTVHISASDKHFKFYPKSFKFGPNVIRSYLEKRTNDKTTLMYIVQLKYFDKIVNINNRNAKRTYGKK